MKELIESKKSASETETFVAPRHWMAAEELTPAYWSDAKKQELRGQEFLEKPIESLEALEKSKGFEVARRDFLTLMGASMAMATLSCARRPVNKIVPYVMKPAGITPGVPNWYASTCTGCSVGCGTLVKTREGRPIKIEGNPDHPINRGKLCGRGQASLLNLYDPDRLRGPVVGGDPKTWKDVDAHLSGLIRAAASEGGVRVLARSVPTATSLKVLRDFVGQSRAKMTFYKPFDERVWTKAQALSYGRATLPQYRFDKADVVLSVGADFLGEWLSPVEHSNDWIKRRKLIGQNPAQAVMSRLISFDSHMDVTTSNADERISIRSGDELKVLLALANALSSRGMAVPAEIQALVASHAPAKVASDVGFSLTDERIKKVADELWAARGRSIIVSGGPQVPAAQQVDLQLVTNWLNSALGNEGSTVFGAGEEGAFEGEQSLAALIEEMNAGKVKVLILDRVNPAYSLPATAGFEAALGKVATVVAVTDRVDETAKLAKFVLPLSHGLESWGDANPRAGVYSIQQPTIAPIYDTRTFEENLLAWMGVSTSWHDTVQEYWKSNLHGRFGGGQSFESFWETALEKGVVGSPEGAGGRAFRSTSLKDVKAPAANGGADAIVLASYARAVIGDGYFFANNAWAHEMPEPLTQSTWDNHLNISPTLARKFNITNNDVVRITSDAGQVEAAALIQPGLHPQSVTIAMGYGRTASGAVGNTAGIATVPLSAWRDGQVNLSGSTVKLEKTGRRYEVAVTQGHFRSENRPILNDITLAEFRKNPATENETAPELRLKEEATLWPEHEWSKDYRWGLSIDVNSCTGCGACVIACQAENNIPVVGRDRVRTSREMQWIRIDRYFSGPEDDPEVVFHPMMCQHCENAPCETVCPVLATVHSNEGLNDMAYNRCVGTRYCQNNCPYKVRRFNYFDHWKNYRESQNLVWNPDVTVRSRGIMEKCTFCVQRIESARQTQKSKGKKIQDGDVLTACQQTCPTDAIVFGNMKDPESRLSKLMKEPQHYRVLEVLNTRPSVTYLSKIRNKEKGNSHGDLHS